MAAKLLYTAKGSDPTTLTVAGLTLTSGTAATNVNLVAWPSLGIATHADGRQVAPATVGAGNSTLVLQYP